VFKKVDPSTVHTMSGSRLTARIEDPHGKQMPQMEETFRTHSLEIEPGSTDMTPHRRPSISARQHVQHLQLGSDGF
jgi:hypothetical protein